MKFKAFFRGALIIGVIAILYLFVASMMNPQKGLVPSTINDVFMPGSQPLESGTLANPDQCDNCHGGYDQDVEPAFNWRGSMMAQAQRDPLYLACLAISNQDAPEVGDLCIRCHSPKGWLEGRSEPTDGSALTVDDRESVQCHFCHRMIAPTPVGVNPYPFDALYTTQPGNNPSTYTIDQGYLPTITAIPPTNANGMYIVDDEDNRRGPYFDPQANHSVPYSPFHPGAALCGTCHDVSNPVFETQRDINGNIIGYKPGDFDTPPIDFSPYAMFPIERTYSEWLMSDYNTPGGISGTYFGGNKPYVSTCQDCHMRDVTGHGCNKSYAPLRDDLPLHDMTGGNTFMPDLVESLFPGEVNSAALAAGKLRALDMLKHAASMEVTVNQLDREVIVKITNETGHKLPSGYPEGRRIWINMKAFNSLTAETYESGHYDFGTGYLTKTDSKIYEIKPGLSPGLAAALGLEAGPSFHFVLNDTIYSDNRIPPRGFSNENFETIQSPPVGYSYQDGQYWDETTYQLPFYPDSVEVRLYYQTTSKEYVEFLRDENYTNNAGQVMYDLWNANGKSTPEIMNYDTWSGPPVQGALTLDLKIFLEGPFEGTTMHTDLVAREALPVEQPYNMAPWNYNGSESVAAFINPNIVDWILIELRETAGDASTATSETMIAQKAALLLSDGSVVETDEASLPEFDISFADNLFAVVWHRNHLGIMSALPVTMTGGVYAYDFTSDEGQVYGGNLAHKLISTGIWGMVGADGDPNGTIDIDDKTLSWLAQAGLKGYLSGDFNLDIQVDNKDKNEIWVGNVYSDQVPDNIPQIIYECKVPK
ncbi:MAG: hypothetical protein JW731_13485 [Bacteroidales bacterium]|nr:hypothetical protein [Bacteroidales bacterium]